MKLWVDDIRIPPDSSWATARTVTEASRLSALFVWDEISLDHDIGHHELQAYDENCRVKLDVPGNVSCTENFTPVAYLLGEKYSRMPEHKVPHAYPVATNYFRVLRLSQ